MRDAEIIRLQRELCVATRPESVTAPTPEQAAALDQRLAKLDELIAQHAQALAGVTSSTELGSSPHGTEAAPAADLDQQLDIAVFELELEESLATIHALESSAAARSAAYRRLLRQVELMVNTGRVQAVHLPEGRIRLALPRAIDIVDPWAGKPEASD